MARPRGRPISEDIGDALADRRRKEKRERMRRLRLQQKSQFAALPQPAAKPLQHGEFYRRLDLDRGRRSCTESIST